MEAYQELIDIDYNQVSMQSFVEESRKIQIDRDTYQGCPEVKKIEGGGRGFFKICVKYPPKKTKFAKIEEGLPLLRISC
jgi:hypothetical protein